MSGASRGPSTSHFEGLLERVRGGDEAAKDEIIRDAYPRARRLTRFILRGEVGELARGETDHVLSLSYEKFARALKHGLRRDFANLAEMLGYLGQIVRHTAIDEVRSITGVKHSTQFPGLPLPEDCAGDVGKRYRFQEMVEGLPEDLRTIVDLKFQYDCNDTEIAERMGIGRTTVGRKLAEAMLRLKADFDATGAAGEN